MRKIKLFLSLLMLIAFGVGNVWGAEVVKATLDFTEGGWDIPTSGTNKNEASFTKDGITIKLAASTNYKQNNGYLILGKAASTLTLPAFTWKTTKIEVVGHSGASASVKQNIYVGENAVSTETTGANDVTNTYAIATDYQAAGNIYVFTVTSAHNTQIDKILIYSEEESGDEPGGGDEPTPGDDPTPATSDDLAIDFESEASAYSAWNFVNMTTKQTNSNVEAHGNSYFGTTGGKTTASVTTKNKVVNPGAITFYYSKTSTNSAESTWYVQVSEDGTNWTNVGDGESAGLNVNRGTWYEMTRDLSSYSNVYVRVYYNGGTSTAIRTIDDVTITLADGKASAGLAYETSAYLVKANGSLETPTLTNPNSLTVAYTSSDDNVVAVDANSGALTIKAAGKAEITASFAGNDDYKAGSAKYTIYVAEQAGTADDPLTVTSAKALIDLGCTLNAHVTGTVSSQHATYFTINLTEGFRFYNAKDLGNVAFETAYLKLNDGVTAYGQLAKSGTSYQLAEGCYLTDYDEFTESLTPIANTKETAYTVAQALAFAAEPATYDLSDHVYIKGVVYSVKNFNTNNGTYDIYIRDANKTENDGKFEFFKCSGLYQVGETAVPFEEGDVQEGDEVIGYGVMTYYSQNSIWEFGQPNQLVDLNRPEVAVTGVELDQSTASIEVGETVTLHATVNPENASNKGITWSVQSGNNKAEVDENGVVTGIAAGEAVVRATSNADNTKYAECTVTVTAADPTKHVVTFDATVDKTTEATDLSITKSNLTIAITEGDGRFNNGTDYRPYKNAVFTVSCSAGNITKIEFTCTTSKPITGFADLEGLDKTNEVWTGNAASVSFTASGAQVQMTQLVITYKEDVRPAAGLAWDPSDDIELTVGDAFTAPTLLNPNNIDAAEITIASSNTDVATVDAGVVSLVADATGTTTITATFAGNDDYKPATVSYTITVNAAAPAPLTDYYQKVTETAGIVEGTYLIVYENGENSLAFNGALGYDSDHKIDIENNTIDVAIVDGDKIAVSSATEASTFYIDPTVGSIQAACGKFIGVGSYSNGLSVSDNADAYVNALSIDDDDNAVIVITTTGGDMTLRYNMASNQARFRYYKSGQQPIALYKLANEVIKPEAGLAWDPATDIEITVGDALPGRTLLNPNSIDAAEITIASSNTDVATVDAGVVSLVADATGTTTITATFAGNASYKPATVSYKIKVNPAHSIYVDKLNVNFGSVTKDEALPTDQKITVTLNNVAAATATLGGTNPDAFSVDKTALTESGDITISVVSSATVGEFKATLTISDDASVAASKEVKLSFTVTDPASEETPISTSTEWVAATEIADGMQVLITGVKDEVVYAMGEQKSTNRAAYVATLNEGVLTPGEGTMAFTLVAQGDGTYAIRTSNGKYLYAAASGSNHLKTQDEVDVNAKWTLTVASAVAEGSSNRNVMQFNGSGTNKLFACYATANQSAIQFYVPKPVTPPTPDYETVRSDLEINRYYTVCLPKKVTAIKGASFWTLKSKSQDGATAYLEEETNNLPFAAGTPFIIQATADKLEVVYEGDATNVAGTNGALHGTLVYMDAAALAAAGSDVYMLFSNELHPVGENNHLDANRAYVLLSELNPVAEAPQSAPGKRVRAMPMQPQVATGIDALNASDAPAKVLINGQLFIIRGEKMFDAKGQLVK